MWPLSAAATLALAGPHTALFSAEVLEDGVTIATLDLVGGQVKADASRAMRRHCQVQLADPTGTLTPRSASDLLAPFGRELKLYRGVRVPDEGDVLVPQGVFVFDDVTVSRDAAGAVTITLAGMDRSARIAAAGWASPFTIAAGTTVDVAVAAVLDDRVPGLPQSLALTAVTLPRTVLGLDGQSDPWRDVVTLAAAAGMELYANLAGVIVLRPVPDPDTDPVVASYRTGATSTLLDVSRRSDTGTATYNGVIVSGEGTGAATPVRAEAWDDDPDSPTYRYGPFGSRPRRIVTALATTTAQAQTIADAELRKVRGAVEDVTFTAVVNPAHEVGDVVHITDPTVGVDRRYLLDAFTMPLTHDAPMAATTRSRRT